jgi:heme exporter protein D
MSTFFAMGGYAAYVWPAYGISALSLLAATWLTLRAHRRAKAQLEFLESRRS